jgi:hypothetical protein
MNHCQDSRAWNKLDKFEPDGKCTHEYRRLEKRKPRSLGFPLDNTRNNNPAGPRALGAIPTMIEVTNE